MEETKKLVIAKRVKKPLFSGTTYLFPLVIITILVALLTKPLNLFFQYNLYGLFQLNFDLVLVTCISLFCLEIIIIFLIAYENYCNNKLDTECITFEKDIFTFKNIKTFNIYKGDIISVNLKLNKKNDSFGSIFINARIYSKKRRLSIYNIENAQDSYNTIVNLLGSIK